MSVDVRLYLLDVEGTVAPLSLVSEQLFPYARRHFESFLGERIAEREIHGYLDLLCEENRGEQDRTRPLFALPQAKDGWPEVIPSAIAYLIWLMDRDRKSTALKILQGEVWRGGFESGQLKGTLFEDVPLAFARWSRDSRVAIYSSGSVEAQQLLFRHSIFGDLTPRISNYFDTRTGPKMAAASYAAIAGQMGVAAGEVLFLSDVVRELDAAREAGCQTRLVVREGNAPVGDANGHPRVESLALL